MEHGVTDAHASLFADITRLKHLPVDEKLARVRRGVLAWTVARLDGDAQRSRRLDAARSRPGHQERVVRVLSRQPEGVALGRDELLTEVLIVLNHDGLRHVHSVRARDDDTASLLLAVLGVEREGLVLRGG